MVNTSIARSRFFLKTSAPEGKNIAFVAGPAETNLHFIMEVSRDIALISYAVQFENITAVTATLGLGIVLVTFSDALDYSIIGDPGDRDALNILVGDTGKLFRRRPETALVGIPLIKGLRSILNDIQMNNLESRFGLAIVNAVEATESVELDLQFSLMYGG